MPIPKGLELLGAEYENCSIYVEYSQTVILSETDEWLGGIGILNVGGCFGSSPRQIFMSVVQTGTLKTRMFADRRWRC